MPLGYRPVSSSQYGEAGFGRCGRDQLDNYPIADEGLGAPVLAYEGEEPVLDLDPLADAGRQVADPDVEAEFAGQLLQLALPQPDPRAIAASAIGGHQQPGRVGVARLRGCATTG